MKLNRDQLAQRARNLAIAQGITVREGYRELGRRAGEASDAKRREKQLSTRPTLPVFLPKEAPTLCGATRSHRDIRRFPAVTRSSRNITASTSLA
jgi:hypothetical protein